MPKLSKQDAELVDYGPVAERSVEAEGFALEFVTFKEDLDGRPLLRGLPGDLCQCPHWGYVLSGRITFEFPSGTEIYEAGDAYYTPPGHAPISNEPGTEVLMISPKEELARTMEVMERNLQALQST